MTCANPALAANIMTDTATIIDFICSPFLIGRFLSAELVFDRENAVGYYPIFAVQHGVVNSDTSIDYQIPNAWPQVSGVSSVGLTSLS